MAARWIEALTGSIEEKKQYKRAGARIEALPAPYGDAAAAIWRYLMYHGSIEKGDVLIRMYDDLADLFEQSAAEAVSVRGIVGDDPVEFAENFLANYTDGQWINKERARMTDAIDRAVDAQREGGEQ